MTQVTTEVRYSVWAKVGLVLGYPLMVLLTGCIAYLAVSAPDSTLAGWGVAIGFWVVVAILVRTLLLAWPLLQFLDVRIAIGDSGLTVRTRGVERAVRWDEVGRVRNSAMAQVLEVYLGDGSRLIAVDWWISGYKELHDALQSNKGRARRSLAT